MFKPFCCQHVICTGADEATGGRQSSLGRDASKVPQMQTADCYAFFGHSRLLSVDPLQVYVV